MQLGQKGHTKESKGKIIIAKGRNSQMDSKKDNRVYRAALVLIKNSFVFFSRFFHWPKLLQCNHSGDHSSITSSQPAAAAAKLVTQTGCCCRFSYRVHTVHVYIYRSATTTAIDQNSPSEPILQDTCHTKIEKKSILLFKKNLQTLTVNVHPKKKGFRL
jgi:hypothetical protein